jgi:hypothetical protein
MGKASTQPKEKGEIKGGLVKFKLNTERMEKI